MVPKTAVARTAGILVVLAAGVPTTLLTCGHRLGGLRVEDLREWVHDPLHLRFVGWATITAGWALWAAACLTMLAHIGSLLPARRGRHVHLRFPGPVQSLYAALLGAATVSSVTSALPTPTAPVADAESLLCQRDHEPPAPPDTEPAQPSSPHPTSPQPGGTNRAQKPPTAAVTPSRTGESPPAVAAASYTVRRGDTLFGIAAHRLDDAERWPDIYTLNRGTHFPHGGTLTDPDVIRTGWTLRLPHDTRHPSSASASAAAPSPADTPHTRTRHTPAAPVSPTGDTTAPPATPQRSPADETSTPNGHPSTPDHQAGITLPSHGWLSLGLAAVLAAVASLLRLQRRRHARLGFPIPARLGAQPTPLPASLAAVDHAGVLRVFTDDEPHGTTPAVPAPIGLNHDGAEVSLFTLPGPGLALTGSGAEAAARAILAATLATGVTGAVEARPVVVTTTDVLARLLPPGAPPVGLDPDQTSFDGERLIVLDELGAAVTHAEEEMIIRRRLLDTLDLDSITALNARTDHAEAQPPYVVLIEATTRHAGRLLAVGAHRAALQLHPVILGALDGMPTAETAADGTITHDAAGLARLSTLTAADLAAVLAMLTDAAPRPEPGHDLDLAPTDAAGIAEASAEPIPTQASGTTAPVRLRVLGPLLLDTPGGPVATGMRSGSYTVLACLAIHPSGRTLEQLAADLHPHDDPRAAGKRIRTDISTLRKVLRTATGRTEAMFVHYDPASGRYTIDPHLIAVDLWHMLTAIQAANTADDDTTALTALRQAAALYTGDFADGKDQTWISDHATTYRHQILSVYARIAEITEPEHPDQAIAALETALQFDPINEELYQRIMRIHGRARRPDVVRRTLRRLEDRLAELGDAEPSEATRRVAERQLRPATTGSRGPR